jgi:hypothetical protein
VEIKAAMRANFTFFNGLMLFAQFQGNCFFSSRESYGKRKDVARRMARKIRSVPE